MSVVSLNVKVNLILQQKRFLWWQNKLYIFFKGSNGDQNHSKLHASSVSLSSSRVTLYIYIQRNQIHYYHCKCIGIQSIQTGLLTVTTETETPPQQTHTTTTQFTPLAFPPIYWWPLGFFFTISCYVKDTRSALTHRTISSKKMAAQNACAYNDVMHQSYSNS